MKIEDLKKKVADSGYMSLSGDERKAYQEHNKKEKEAGEAKTPPTPSKEETVTMTKDELQKMIKEEANNAVTSFQKHQSPVDEKYGEWKEVEIGEGAFPTAKLRVYQKDTKSPKAVVIRADFLRMDLDMRTQKYDNMIFELELLYDDETKETIEMSAEEFTKLNQTETIELIENDRRMMKQVSGKVGLTLKDKDGYPVIRVDGGGYGSKQGVVGEVDLEVIRYDEQFIARRPNGQTFSIHANQINT